MISIYPPPDSPVSAQFVPVQHASDMQCFGYVLRTGDDSLYFSGDAARLPEQVKERFLAGEIKRIYHDTASHESQAHCWYRRLEDDIPPQRRSDVFCMHLDGDYADQLRQRTRTLPCRVIELAIDRWRRDTIRERRQSGLDGGEDHGGKRHK